MVEAIAEGIGQFAAGLGFPLNRVGDLLEGAEAGKRGGPPVRRIPKPTKPPSRAGMRLPVRSTSAARACLHPVLQCARKPRHGERSLQPPLDAGVGTNRGAGASRFARDAGGRYLPKLVSGEWSGTMNLTEPQAGATWVLCTRLRRSRTASMSRKSHRPKIYITWGEHELSKNIIHLVLARRRPAPGTRYLAFRCRNSCETGWNAGRAQRCAASALNTSWAFNARPPTMEYGDNEECISELVGAEFRGYRGYVHDDEQCARLNVGNQGVQHRRTRDPAGAGLRTDRRAGGARRRGRAVASSTPTCAHPRDG